MEIEQTQKNPKDVKITMQRLESNGLKKKTDKEKKKKKKKKEKKNKKKTTTTKSHEYLMYSRNGIPSRDIIYSLSPALRPKVTVHQTSKILVLEPKRKQPTTLLENSSTHYFNQPSPLSKKMNKNFIRKEFVTNVERMDTRSVFAE